MREDDLPADTGDHRPVTQRTMRQAMHSVGKDIGAQLKDRDDRIAKLEKAVGLLTMAVERERAKH